MQGLANHAQRILDGWQNCLTGLGTSTDKGAHNRYTAGAALTAAQLSDSYRHNWLVRRLVEAVPNRALARGFDPATLMPPAFDDLNYAQWDEGALQRAAYFGALYGGAHLFIGYNGGGADLAQPVTSQGSVAYLDVFTRHELQPARIGGVEARELTPDSPRMGQVNVWEVIGDHPRRGMLYHATRAIKFGGRSQPPQALQGKQANWRGQAMLDRDWSDSVLQSVWDDVERYGVFWQSVSHLIQVASIGVLKVGGLIESLSHESGAVMKARIDILNQCLAITRNLMLDASANEDYSRASVSFADLPQLLDQCMIATSGAFKMPTTELFGRAPQGMNATGEGDRVMWYADVSEWRQRVLRPRVNFLAEAISGVKKEIKYPEIHQPTDAEKEELRGKSLAATRALWDIGAFSEQEIRNAAQAQLPVELHAKTPEAPEKPEPPPNPFFGQKPPPGVEPEEEEPAAGGAKPGASKKPPGR